MSWEKRGAVEYRKKKAKNLAIPDPVDDEELDCFGTNDVKSKFDYRHFFFTLFRGIFLLFFAFYYLFSSRFSIKAKLIMLFLGITTASVIVVPVLAFAYAPAVDIQGEPALVWGPVIFYVLLLLTHSTIEGNWKESGGVAASLNHLDLYSGQVLVMQRGNGIARSKRRMKGGEFITCLIESEQSAQYDPWEYIFLSFILSPIIGVCRAGLFILVDYLLLSRAIPINEEPFVHVIYAWFVVLFVSLIFVKFVSKRSMILNFVTTTIFLSLLGITAYIYRRQLLLIRRLEYVTSKRDSAKFGIPYLPLTTVENVRMWAAMRTFAISEKSHLPITSANVMAAFALLLTGILWIVILVLVFVDRSQRLLLVPLNISLIFFAVMTFYYVVVCVRQHMIMNKQLRSHSAMLGRESIRNQMAIETKQKMELVPAQTVIKLLGDLLKLDIQTFRFLGMDINQNSMNSMFGFFLTLTVASVTNIAIDLGSTGPSPIICVGGNYTQ